MQVHIVDEGLEPVLRSAFQTLREGGMTAADAADEPAALSVRFQRMDGQGCSVRFNQEAGGLTVHYTDVAAALRGMGAALGADRPESLRDEHSGFRTLGIMLDCSRNAVMRVEHFERWLGRLALLGFNMAMLYTEDTYELPGEPWFGYMRGGYSPDELRRIDAYAASLGIEMIPCIQTLGHLEQVLRWPAYSAIRDTSNVMLAGAQECYDLIEKMLDNWAAVFQSRRIHIGMDEAMGLGRGRYFDRFGVKPAFDIFNEHLANVMRLCGQRGYRPMIWSDMYFRLGCESGDYYDPATVIPDEVRRAIPPQVQLVYWDYYHRDEAFYADWIARHRALGHEPIMATGAWTWGRPWHATTRTERQAGPAVRAGRAAGLSELLVTLWGDDGAMCDTDSAFAGLAFIADLAWGGDGRPQGISPRFAAICGDDYAAARLAGKVSTIEYPSGDGAQPVDTWAWMWDDPLLTPHWRHQQARDASFWDAAVEHFAQVRDGLVGRVEEDVGAGNVMQSQRIADWLARKIALRRELEEAYALRDRARLLDLLDPIARIIDLCQAYGHVLRRQWLTRHKPFGMEVAQVRIAGHVERWRELARRIEALAAGEATSIPELELAAPGPPWPQHGAFRHVAKGSVSPI